MVARSRMPPPNCVKAELAWTAASTRRHINRRSGKGTIQIDNVQMPEALRGKGRAWSAGSSLKIVARAMSPCSRRTQRPSFKSMAGKIIMASIHKFSMSRKPAAWLFQGETACQPYCCAPAMPQRPTIIGFGDNLRLIFRARRIAVHKIEIRAIQTVKHSMARAHVQRVPAHMRYFEGRGHIQRIHRSGKPAQPLMLAALGAGAHTSCMPTQMPRNGRPSSTTRASSAARSPSIAARPCAQSPKAPTPGRTIWSAHATTSGSPVT